MSSAATRVVLDGDVRADGTIALDAYPLRSLIWRRVAAGVCRADEATGEQLNVCAGAMAAEIHAMFE